MTNSTDNPIVSADARGRVTLGSWAQDSKFSVTNNLDGTVTLTPEAKPEPIAEDLMVYAHRQAPGIYVTLPAGDTDLNIEVRGGNAVRGINRHLLAEMLAVHLSGPLRLPLVINQSGMGIHLVDGLLEDYPDTPVYVIDPYAPGARDWPSYKTWNARKYPRGYQVALRDETLEALKKATTTEIVFKETEDIYEKIKGLTLGEFDGDSPENVENRRLLNLLARGK